jgi:regulator of nucleoside diphosphate kinase
MTAFRDICLTELDVVRIESMLHDTRFRIPGERTSIEALEQRLDAARIVHQSSIESHVVTMNSVVVLVDCATSAETELTLVYPRDADPERGRVSVLSPMGRALLGTGVGDRVRIAVPGQPDKVFLVTAVPYQPEANGHYDV